MSFPNIITAPYGEQFNSHSSERHPLGTILEFADGRRFRYCLNANAAMAAGKLYQAPALVAEHVDEVVQAATAVGARSIPVTIGATAVTADQYKYGFICINDDSGEGHMYGIDAHAAVDASGTFTVPLIAGETVRVALTTSTTVSIFPSIYNKPIIHPSPPVLPLVGVAPFAVAANKYCWLQTRGPAAVLTEGTLVAGKMCMASATTDGAVCPPVLTEGTPNTGDDRQLVGRVMRVEATTEYSAIFLMLE